MGIADEVTSFFGTSVRRGSFLPPLRYPVLHRLRLAPLPRQHLLLLRNRQTLQHAHPGAPR